MNNILVEVSIPSDYHTDLSRPVRKMTIYGWYQEENPDKRWQRGFGVFVTQRGWLEEARLVGTAPHTELSVVVTTNGSSWFAQECYSNHEEAERRAASIRNDMHAWAVRVPRLG